MLIDLLFSTGVIIAGGFMFTNHVRVKVLRVQAQSHRSEIDHLYSMLNRLDATTSEAFRTIRSKLEGAPVDPAAPVAAKGGAE